MSDAGQQRLATLSPRERQVLDLLLEGHSSKQIALQTHVVEKTVGTQKTSILKKLQVDNIVELVKFALREGVITL